MTAWTDIQNRSRWMLDGRVVEVRGVSPTTIWIVVVDAADQTQVKMVLTQFLRRARRA